METVKRVVTPKVSVMRGRCLLALFLAILASGFLFVRSATATIILGPAINFSTETNNSSFLLVNNLVFSHFSISGDILAGDVNITPIQDNFGFGIRFSGAFVASSSNTLDMILTYKVSITNGAAPISDVHLLFNGSVIGDGLAEAIEQVSSSNSVFLGQLQAYNEATTNQLEDSLNLFPADDALNLSKDVLLSSICDGFASISTIDQTFSQVPEPSALALCTLGLVGIRLIRRRRKTGS